MKLPPISFLAKSGIDFVVAAAATKTKNWHKLGAISDYDVACVEETIAWLKKVAKAAEKAERKDARAKERTEINALKRRLTKARLDPR